MSSSITTFYNVTPLQLYRSTITNSELGPRYYEDRMRKAIAWIEAEMIYEMWFVLQDWFEKMETGEIESIYPDPFWDDSKYGGKANITLELANNFIDELDQDFQKEKSRFKGANAPEFWRLSDNSKIALLQRLYPVLKTQKEMEDESTKRLNGGEEFPPYESESRRESKFYFPTYNTKNRKNIMAGWYS